MKKTIFLLLLLVFALSLSACGSNNAAKPSSPSDSAVSTQNGHDVAKSQTVKGIVNRLDGYLVLLADDDYHVFTLGKGVTLAGLEEGDNVTVTYTGTLKDTSTDPVAIVIEKN